MFFNQKSLNLNYPNPVLVNLCIYFFISSVIYYLFSLNITLLKLILIFSSFISVFYLSSKKSELLLQKMQLKNIIIISKFLLGIITLAAAVLVYNNFSLSSIYLYFLILTTASLYAVLNRAYNYYYEQINKNHKIDRNREIMLKFNLEKLIIVITAAAAAFLIKINFIPFILIGIAFYYFISAYINTFQQI
jgi:hypothetical protein